MGYRINKQGLLDTLSSWDGFLKKKVHLIACGGTAMTLLEIKESTKDIDLIIPNTDEHEYIIKVLRQLGYKSTSGWGWSRDGGFVFDLFKGKYIITELLESPLENGNHFLVKEFSHIYLGVLNYYDIIISKIFRSSSVDINDCLLLLRSKKDEIDFRKLEDRFRETAAYNISEAVAIKNWEHFLKLAKKEAIYG
jgi:hypothetical protein